MLENVDDHGKTARQEHPERPPELRIGVIKLTAVQVTKDNEESCAVAEECEKRKPAKQSIPASADSHRRKRCDNGENKNRSLKLTHGFPTA